MLVVAAGAFTACPDGVEHGQAQLVWQRYDTVAGFVASGSQVDLGAVDLRSPLEVRFRLANVGRAAVEVEAVALDDVSAFGLGTATAELPRRLAPGDSLEVVVTAAPGTVCAFAAALSVTAAAPAAAPPPLDLSVRGVDPAGSATALTLSANDLSAASDWSLLGPGATLAFAARLPGGRDARLVRVDNTGSCPVTVGAAGFALGNDFALSVDPAPLALAPGGSLVLPVAFAPVAGAAGDRADVLVLTTSAGTRDLPVRGRVGAPAVTFLVGSGGTLTPPGASGLDFGATEAGSRVARVVRIVNGGDAPLEITGIAIDLDLFQAGWGSGDGVLTLGPGAVQDLSVVFTPDAAGSRVATLSVATSAGAATLQLVGRGLAGVLALLLEDPPGSGTFASLESDGEIDFGPADPGDESYRLVRLVNAGDGVLTVTKAVASNGFRTFLPVPIDLAPDAQRDFLVRFRPVATVASYTGALEIETNRGIAGVVLTGSLTRVCGTATPAPAVPDGPCVPDGTTLCLVAGRFAVTAANQDTACGGGVAQVAVVGATSGSFTFAGAGWDLVVNMVDDCAGSGSFGLRVAGPTRDRVELRVVDAQTGAVKTWFNPLGEPFVPLIDATAFDTCP